MNEQKFPPGWNEERVRRVIAHYENETEDEQFAEIEAGVRSRRDHDAWWFLRSLVGLKHVALALQSVKRNGRKHG